MKIKYKNSKIESSCPVCSSRLGHLLYEVNSSQAAQHFIQREVDHQKFMKLKGKIEELWGQSTCFIIRCDNCNFVYSNPYVSGDSQFYNLAFEGSGYPRDKWEYKVTIDAINEYIKNKGSEGVKLLEIGAGDGAFINKIIPSVLDSQNITATEFSENGINKLRTKGITVLTQDILQISMDKYSNYFEFICMFQVLEHLNQLEALFKKLYEITKDHARVFIAVPNENRIEFNELNDALLDMPPNHIGRWSKKSFEAIGEKTGWKVNKYQKEPYKLFSDFKMFAIYRYLRKMQFEGSIPNRIEEMKNGFIRTVLRGLCCFYISISSSYLIPRMIKKDLGMSQWIELKKFQSNEN